MYSGSGFSEWEIGDITVILHKEIYHLFHLIIPNHDYIAHAVSADGISWKRVDNALFVGNPGQWDDDMLWTMHVVKTRNKFQMYYTGLQRKDRGVISRVGLAESRDLLHWKKVANKKMYPIEPKGKYYESIEDNPRKWLSFRDPYYFEYKGECYLIVCARTNRGAVSRRGCAGVVKISNNTVELLPPLLCPMVYDDVECPCVFELKGKFYLIGSIREDVKVRYWFAPDLFGEYHSFHADVLLPQGNYAARVVKDGNHLLVYNFFYIGKIDSLRVLPPPKELDADDSGRLLLKSYYRWNMEAINLKFQSDINSIKRLIQNETAFITIEDNKWTCGTRSGYEIFCFESPAGGFIWEGFLTVEGMGKFGLVSDMDDEGNGYFISIDVSNGLLQIRSWGFNPLDTKQNFIFSDIQSGIFPANKSFRFRLIRYGRYIELAIDDVVKLTLMDYTYYGKNIGIYSASSIISLQESSLKLLPQPEEEYASQEQTEKFPKL